jgi:hypothetical protein
VLTRIVDAPRSRVVGAMKVWVQSCGSQAAVDSSGEVVEVATVTVR